jgi:hypothetical protein
MAMRVTYIAAVVLFLAPLAAWGAEGKPPIFDGLATTKDADAYVACVTQAYARQWPGTRAATFPDGHQVLIGADKDGPAVAEMSVANRLQGKSLVTLRGEKLPPTTKHDLGEVMQQCR